MPVDASLHTWVMANEELISDDRLVSTALIIYSTYRAVNFYRHHGHTDRETAMQFMKQAINQGVRGHRKAAGFLNGLWDQSSRPTAIFSEATNDFF